MLYGKYVRYIALYEVSLWRDDSDRVIQMARWGKLDGRCWENMREI